jgi:hypothetical protein
MLDRKESIKSKLEFRLPTGGLNSPSEDAEREDLADGGGECL